MKTIVALLALGLFIAFIAIGDLLPPVPLVPDATTATPQLTSPIIRATDPQRGSANAPIVLVEFADFSCPRCKEIQPMLARVIAKFPGKILQVWKDFPVPAHPEAPAAHAAAACANEQGKFWEYHDRLFARTSPYDSQFAQFATEIHLDTPAFTECLASGTMTERIREDLAEAQLLEVDEVPTFFINNERVRGNVDEVSIEAIITKNLAQ